jgi:copper chaperone
MMKTTRIKIEGMHCDGCASRVQGLLEKEPGVREAEVSYRTGEARVKFNEHTIGADRLRQVVEQAGYTTSGAT